MFVAFFQTVVYAPIYNALALVVSWVPGGDVGVAIVLITVVVKLVLFPLAVRASRTQRAMRRLQPRMDEIKEKHKDNKQELAKATLALYRAEKVNPFASILILIVQLPVILGLYWVILTEGAGGAFDPAHLYSWVAVPENASFVFLGLIPIAQGSILLAILVAVTQYVQAKLMMPEAPVATGKGFMDDLASSMHFQMRYVFPIILAVIAYVASAAIALYFIVSNVVGIIQEMVAHARHKKEYGN